MMSSHCNCYKRVHTHVTRVLVKYRGLVFENDTFKDRTDVSIYK